MIKHQYRVTKYDPSFRNESGVYLRHEWTSISDIGRKFWDGLFTYGAYENAETAYIMVAMSFLQEAKESRMRVVELENSRHYPVKFAKGSALEINDLETVIRQVLREEYWCRLESEQCFLHFGYDYYMYIGVPSVCPESVELASQVGLHVEPRLSPYNSRL